MSTIPDTLTYYMNSNTLTGITFQSPSPLEDIHFRVIKKHRYMKQRRIPMSHHVTFMLDSLHRGIAAIKLDVAKSWYRLFWIFKHRVPLDIEAHLYLEGVHYGTIRPNHNEGRYWDIWLINFSLEMLIETNAVSNMKITRWDTFFA